MHRVTELGTSGRGGSRGRDAGGRGGGGRRRGSRGSRGSPSKGRPSDQSEVNKVTWLQTKKYYTAKEYTKFTAAKKQWIHQHRTKSPATKPKVAAVSRGDDNAAGESDDDSDLFDNHNNESLSSKCSTC
jgi:hypothetical protein